MTEAWRIGQIKRARLIKRGFSHEAAAKGDRWSFQRVLVFWWILFVVVQQAERLFLLPEAWSLEPPTSAILLNTLGTGLRADLIVAALAVVVAMAVALFWWLPYAILLKLRGIAVGAGTYCSGLMVSSLGVAVLILGLLMVEMGYYTYNYQHLDFVFFEYVDDLFSSSRLPGKLPVAGSEAPQAYQQTIAELINAKKWVLRLLGFIMVQSAAILGWRHLFRRYIEPAVIHLESAAPRATSVLLVIGVVAAGTGLHSKGPWSIARVAINNSVYYTLAQNPLWYTGDVLYARIESEIKRPLSDILSLMPLGDAVQVARDTLAPGATFPEPGYPFVREAAWNQGLRLEGSPNVLLLFVEGLDRRYLGQTVAVGGKQNVRIRLTPFLDRLKDDSIYFEHFFSNGAQTHHGLFASFCSYYARYGRAAIKARYTYNYLCLPALLGKTGYRTEMVIGQNRDHNQDHTALFLARNGLQHFFDENDFPADAERLGFGMTDGALFDFVHARIEKLQQSKERFLLSTLTLSTHHPYNVPTKHPDVRALQGDPDRYLAALRYADLELERFFAALQRDDLLKNTVVLILGDHGRHERNGRTTIERWSGHFTAPLFIWMDNSLRTPTNYQPRTVSTVASQVDLAPTILALAGVSPRVSPFLGRDLSCVLATDCVEDNVAFLSSVYDDLIGLADREGLLLYSLVTHTLYETDLKLAGPTVIRPAPASQVASRYRRLLALYVSSNTVLERNQIWSWKDLGAKL